MRTLAMYSPEIEGLQTAVKVFVFMRLTVIKHVCTPTNLASTAISNPNIALSSPDPHGTFG